MILQFDHRVPRCVQRARQADMKQPGRKHQHRPGTKVLQKRQNAASVVEARRIALRRKLNRAISDYFRGMRELHP